MTFSSAGCISPRKPTSASTAAINGSTSRKVSWNPVLTDSPPHGRGHVIDPRFQHPETNHGISQQQGDNIGTTADRLREPHRPAAIDPPGAQDNEANRSNREPGNGGCHRCVQCDDTQAHAHHDREKQQPTKNRENTCPEFVKQLQPPVFLFCQPLNSATPARQRFGAFIPVSIPSTISPLSTFTLATVPSQILATRQCTPSPQISISDQPYVSSG